MFIHSHRILNWHQAFGFIGALSASGWSAAIAFNTPGWKKLFLGVKLDTLVLCSDITLKTGIFLS